MLLFANSALLFLVLKNCVFFGADISLFSFFAQGAPLLCNGFVLVSEVLHCRSEERTIIEFFFLLEN